MPLPPPSIPDTPEAITPEWLSEVLAGALSGTEVSRVDVVDRHSGTTGRARLRLEYVSGTAGPATIFVKLAPFEEMQRQLVAATDMGRNEARFYAEIAPDVPVRIPGCWFSAWGESPTEYIMVLEDLEASGCTFPADVDALARDYGGAVVESLAHLHARFWENERFASDLAWVPRPMRGPLGAQLVDQARTQHGPDFPPAFTELCRLYVEHHEPICDLWDEGPRTLVHGDIHGGNQFVDGGVVGIYDWAVISHSPGVRDLGIYLCNSCPPEVRRANEEAWLERYRQILVEAGVDAPELSELFRRVRMAALYGWVAATATLAMGDKLQPLEVGLRATRRSTQNCVELETIEAIHEALSA